MAALVAAGLVPVRADAVCDPEWTRGFQLEGFNDAVHALAVFDDGSGLALYAGGAFTTAGGNPASHIARWNGTTWSAVGGGVDATVFALKVFDDGGGDVLFVGGDFTLAGGVLPVNHVAKWTGLGWSAAGLGLDGGVYALETFTHNSQTDLYAGGAFTQSGVTTVNRIARWDGVIWSALGTGVSNGIPSYVRALAVYDNALYAGGAFTQAGSAPASRIARWDGSAWSAVGSGLTNIVNALTVFDDGNGDALYAGGFFTFAGITEVNYVAKWNGTWSAVGGGVDNTVNALHVHDDGSGPALYAGGWFTHNGPLAGETRRIARWDGAAWTDLDAGIGDDSSNPCWCDPINCTINCGPRPGFVNAMTTFAGGLFVGGYFTNAQQGCVPSMHIAEWRCPLPSIVSADFDRDGDVDVADFVHFQVCFNGPGSPPAADCCNDADLDPDNDVDVADFILFQQCFNGPNNPAACP